MNGATTTRKRFRAWLSSAGIRPSLMLVAALMLLIALAEPKLELQRDAHDYLFVIDITGSMNVADAGPARERRLAFAKRLVRGALEELRCGSSAGLAVFTEHRSFLLFAPVEVCDNHLVLATMLDEIDGSMAWAELSEVAKGLYSGIDAVARLAALGGNSGSAAHLVFMTDGHEAPPVHPSLRPRFRGDPGSAGGLIVGIGGLEPLPIPYLDERGEVAGFWAQDEVQQVDRHSAGRPTQGGESMAGIDSGDVQDRIARGTEHLSSLRESYLETLVRETGLDYLRGTTASAFVRALRNPKYARQQRVSTNVAWMPAALALLCLSSVYGGQLWRTRGLSGSRARRRSLRVSGAPLQPSAPHR